ncbi:Abc transporter a family member 1, partial [Globisporangium splendens]
MRECLVVSFRKDLEVERVLCSVKRESGQTVGYHEHRKRNRARTAAPSPNLNKEHDLDSEVAHFEPQHLPHRDVFIKTRSSTSLGQGEAYTSAYKVSAVTYSERPGRAALARHARNELGCAFLNEHERKADDTEGFQRCRWLDKELERAVVKRLGVHNPIHSVVRRLLTAFAGLGTGNSCHRFGLEVLRAVDTVKVSGILEGFEKKQLQEAPLPHNSIGVVPSTPPQPPHKASLPALGDLCSEPHTFDRRRQHHEAAAPAFSVSFLSPIRLKCYGRTRLRVMFAVRIIDHDWIRPHEAIIVVVRAPHDVELHQGTHVEERAAQAPQSGRHSPRGRASDDLHPAARPDQERHVGRGRTQRLERRRQVAGKQVVWDVLQPVRANGLVDLVDPHVAAKVRHSVVDGLNLNKLSAADLATCTQGVKMYGAVSINTSSPNRVPEACAGKIVPYKIGIAPDTAFTRQYFMQTMELWYPRVVMENSTSPPQIPSFQDSVEFFESADAFEDYVKSKEYGTALDKPRIYGGIVFDAFPSDIEIGSFGTIEYTIRLNSTISTRGDMGLIPQTSQTEISMFQRKIDVDKYSRYAVTGFMTLQTLVTRFVTCMPTWNAETKTTTGECQRSQATAKASTTLDDRLLSALSNDALIQDAFASFAPTDATGIDRVLAAMPAASKEALLKPLRQAPQPYLNATVAPFPINAYTSSPFYDQVKDVFALVFILAYLYMVSRILVVFIQEKESRMREFMKILGVKESAILISWYMTYTGIAFVGAILQALAGLAGLFSNSSVVLVFLFFLLFGMSVLAFGFLVSAIFSKARTGSFVGMILFFLMYFVSTAFNEETAENSKVTASILSPVALSFGVTVLSNLESTGQGVSFDNMNVVYENYRFSTTLVMLALDTVLYTLIGLYFEKVVPKEWGTSLKWYFPVSPSYWRNKRRGLAAAPKPHPEDALLDDVMLDVNPNFEPVSTDLRDQERTGNALSVQRLRKVFPVPGGEKIAVKGINLVMYKDQITCLLGHNGAGKTTLISMLTGMTAASSGNATFRGMSLSDDMDEIRESLGICFQHDVLFAELTVEEHLLIFGQIKGYVGDELKAVVETQIREVGLTEKRYVKSSELSGGMKRKLSVAISLLGDSSLVFLDEPTSGMDPYSRRSTWEILLNNRTDRVMVLTTHFMDEADILGDRIAIMAEGELRCCGSSLFLKNRYGAGYNLTFVKDEAGCDDDALISFIQSYIPHAQVLSNVGSEIAFQLPLASSSGFAPMFAEMDTQLSALGLLSYGVSVTTLEEVFIKVAEVDDEDQQHTLGKCHARSGASAASPTHDAHEGQGSAPTGLFMPHLGALLLKRFRIAKRDKKMLFYSMLLPVLLLFLGLELQQSNSLTKNDPKISLTTDSFTAGEMSPTPFYCQADSGSQGWCSSVLDSLHFTGALPQQLSNSVITQPAFDSNSPTVLGVKYTNPSINASDATGYELRLGEKVYKRGYGIDQAAIEGQYGAYLVHGDSDQNVLAYNLLVNTTASHSALIFKALMDQAIYRFFASNTTTSDTSSKAAVNLIVNNHPLPLSASSKALLGSIVALSSCTLIVIAFTFYPASIVTFLVKERQSEHNAKHQQLVSGVSLPAFWLSNYLWDLVIYIVPFVSALIMIKLFDIPAMTGSSDCTSCTSATFPAVIVLFVLFGLAICPFTYCMSYLFKEHASAQTYTIMINFVIGVVLLVISYILTIIDSTEPVNDVLVFFWRISPLFNLGNGLLNLVMAEADAVMGNTGEKKSPFSTDVMGFEMIYLALTAIVFGALAVGIDYALTFPKLKNSAARDHGVDDEAHVEDTDVKREAERVASGAADGDMVALRNLRKVYKGGKVAVRNLSFGLKQGECFGFLGINGAGKTTTMKMLTGDVVPSSGSATLSGFDILNQQIDVRRQIGYCPQFDALFDLLTVREHLELFARIKGVSAAELDSVVEDKIEQMNLSAFEHKLASSLSGGNKRKLSVAIAMIGNPQIIFLDEPSTGMDPVSRRFMWEVIADISTRSKSSTIVLTTHSMEESEALCSRVGIMVGGRLRCLGSVQHLKSRFGDGLVLDVKLVTLSPDELQAMIDQYFEGGDSTFVTPTEVNDKCRSFGNAALADRVVASHPTGYNLAAALERDGLVRAEAFCSWCVEETRFDRLHDFLKKSFGVDGVIVMERQNDFCRFKLRGSTANLKLAKVFALVESVKSTMHVREYSVSQTTLEQIFNQFASRQAEEQGVARGMYAA